MSATYKINRSSAVTFFFYRISRAGFFLILTTFSSLSFAQLDAAVQINKVLSQLNPVNRAAMVDVFSKQQSEMLQQIKSLQVRLDEIRSNPAVNEEAKDAAIAAKEDNVVTAKKSFVVKQATRQILEGTSPSLPPADLAQILPEINESISVAANPMLPICGDTVSYRGTSLQIGWKNVIDQFLSTYGNSIGAIGRIEVETEVPVPGTVNTIKRRDLVGTGFAISANEVVTAGHVAHLFWDREKGALRRTVTGIFFNTGAEHDFNCLSANKNANIVHLKSVSLMEYSPNLIPKSSPLDYAVIQFDPKEASIPSYLTLAAQEEIPKNSFVVIVGYPDKDGRVDQILWKSAMEIPVLNGMYPVSGIKRIAPGLLLQKCDNASVSHLPHDATTLNRSSGAPIIDIATGKVVGIQVAGYRQLDASSVYCNLGLKSSVAKLK